MESRVETEQPDRVKTDIILYGSPFSPFSRKVRLVLELKNLSSTYIDAIDPEHLESLRKVNDRLEVPVLVDGDVTVVNSADIVAYLEHQYPAIPMLPVDPKTRVKARKWERISDTLIDAIFADIAHWHWSNRDDVIPPRMLELAREDLAIIYDKLEAELGTKDYFYDELSIADIALFVHLVGAKAFNVSMSTKRHPNLLRWLGELRKKKEFSEDMARTLEYVSNIENQSLDRDKIFWRGERLEWIFAHGFEEWFMEEVRQDRVKYPPQRP